MGSGLARASSLTEALACLASSDPEQTTATIDSRLGTTVMSRADLADLAASYAGGLRDAGVRQGDRVVVAFPTSSAFLGAFWGCQAMGAVPVPVAPVSAKKPDSVEGRRLRMVLDRARPRAVVGTEEVREVASSHAGLSGWRWADPIPDTRFEDVARAGVDPSSVAVIQFTSGSTSDPRGCVLTHEAIVANLVSVQERLDIFHPMVGATWCPLYHDMGLMGSVALPVWSGYLDIVLQPTTEFLFNPLSWLRQMSDHRAEISSAPNAAFALVARRVARGTPDVDLSCVRSIFNGAEPIDLAVARAFCELLAPVGFSPSAMHPAYGLAEHVVIVASSAGGVRSSRIDRSVLEHEHRAVPWQDAGDASDEPKEDDNSVSVVSVGFPVLGVDVRIVDSSDEPCPVACVGEVEVRSRSIMQGYFEDTTATAATMHEGWLRTGDLGFMEESGELYLVGRKKDLIILGGQNFHAYDIENAATSVPAVRAGGATAFGVPGPNGEALVVVVESRSRPVTEVVSAVRVACSEQTGAVPREVVVVRPGSIPRTSSGKVQRQLTRTSYLAGTLATKVASEVRA